MKTIFVSVASYRDTECPTTLRSLFQNAKNPERIYVGICQQNDIEDTQCYDKNDNILSKFSNNIRQIKLPHFEAKGPTWARYLCSRLWDGEDYYFQIDSHTKVIKNWDEILLSMIEGIYNSSINKKIVLSHYPPVIEDYSPEQKDEIVPRICKSFFNDRGIISLKAAEKMPSNGKTYQVPYMAAGMFFASSDFLKNVPFDPNLPYLFTGEEILLSARFWTHGWDIYTPSQNIAYHFYTRKDEPKFWSDISYSDEEAVSRVKKLLQLTEGDNDENNKKYGLGTERTLKEYYEYAGIQLESKNVDKNFCRIEYKDTNGNVINNIEHFGNTHTTNINQNDISPIFLIIVLLVIIFFVYKI